MREVRVFDVRSVDFAVDEHDGPVLQVELGFVFLLDLDRVLLVLLSLEFFAHFADLPIGLHPRGLFVVFGLLRDLGEGLKRAFRRGQLGLDELSAGHVFGKVYRVGVFLTAC